ncbi:MULTISPECIES: hypothetical protein [unclassified Paenibacillus]|uniref:hypothetical protein n=1 Tax=unclassified Paenibacillus TaxID=185978 RepID=UPI002F41953F
MKVRHLILIVIFFGIIYLITDYNQSYRTINEVLYSENKSNNFFSIKQIIGGSEYNKKAFYFILNDSDQVVGVSLNKGIFGWKFSRYSTGTGLEINKEQRVSKLSISSLQETYKHYFGLTSYANVQKIMINQTIEAELINLKEHLANVNDIENTYLWYANINDKANNFIVEVYDDQNKLIDSE